MPRGFLLFLFVSLAWWPLATASAVTLDASKAVFPERKILTVGEAWRALAPLPEMKDFPSDGSGHPKAAEVDLSSHPDGRKFRTVLREGFKGEPAFAGHYAVAQNGCGTGCTMSWIVDQDTGKIIDMLYSSCGVLFDPDSNLLVVDALDGFDLEDGDEMPAMCNPQYYRMTDGKLVLAKSLYPPEKP